MFILSVPPDQIPAAVQPLLWQHLLDLLIAQSNLMDGVTLSLEGFEVALDVRGEEDLWGGG
jgi:hypothetical protein